MYHTELRDLSIFTTIDARMILTDITGYAALNQMESLETLRLDHFLVCPIFSKHLLCKTR